MSVPFAATANPRNGDEGAITHSGCTAALSTPNAAPSVAFGGHPVDACVHGLPDAADAGAVASVGRALDSRGTTLPPAGSDGGEAPASGFPSHERYRLQRGIARMLRDPETGRGPSVCGCGYAGYEAPEVSLHRTEDGRARTAGVHRCDSLYLCPVCTLRRAVEIQERARRFARASIDAGAWVYMVTLTVRHERGDALAELKDGVTGALRKAQQGAPYKRLQEAGLIGVFRNVEVRHSDRTGWNPHLHCLVAVDEPNEEAAREVARGLVDRYLARLRKDGLSAELAGQDVTLCYDPEKAGEYAGKGALELAHGWAKEGKAGSRSVHPFELARRGLDDADGRAVQLFREYADVMPGTPQGRISDRVVRELAARLDRDEAELAAWLRHGEGEDEAEPGEEPVKATDLPAIARIAAEAWDDLHRRGETTELVQAVEAGATYDQLRAAGYPVRPPLPTDEAAKHPPDPGEDVYRAAHARAPADAPNGSDARADWVKAYAQVHGRAT